MQAANQIAHERRRLMGCKVGVNFTIKPKFAGQDSHCPTCCIH